MSVVFDRASDALVCPACGGRNLHQQAVTVFMRAEDAPITRVTRVVGSRSTSASASSETCGNPSSRRQGLRIEFYCEGCERPDPLVIWQHKGETFVEWERLAEERIGVL